MTVHYPTTEALHSNPAFSPVAVIPPGLAHPEFLLEVGVEAVLP